MLSETRIKANTSLILEKSKNEKILPRQAAVRDCQRESFKGDEVPGILAAVDQKERPCSDSNSSEKFALDSIFDK